MEGVFSILYQGLAVPAVRLLMAVLAPFKAKIRERLRQEAPLWDQAARSMASDQRPRVWFHAASMGELEQLLPIIERIKTQRPEMCIVTTCTSPSGRNHAASQSCIDHALYLPLDRPRTMRIFVDTVKPLLVVIDRYDLWPTMIGELHRRAVPIYVVNATMPSAARWPVARDLTRWLYAQVNYITAVSANDGSQLGSLLERPVGWMPDTRLDRVMERVARATQSTPSLPEWTGKTLVLGSTWPADEQMMLSAMNGKDSKDWRLVIVPHEPTEDALRSIEQRLTCRRLSRLTDTESSETPHILVDSVGYLVELYSIATAAYVGGGFGAGVHSLAEPAGFGLPLACGPGTERSREAALLVEAGALHILENVDDARHWLAQINQGSFCLAARTAAKEYVRTNTGSTDFYVRNLLDALSDRT